MLYGAGGNNRLDGGRFNDLLDGGDGDNVIRGGSSRDTIVGGRGNDTLYGGQTAAGETPADTFYFFRADSGFDRIKDVEDTRDILNLSSFGFVDFDDVLAIASNTGSLSMTLDFGDGTAVVIENFRLDQVDAGDVYLG